MQAHVEGSVARPNQIANPACAAIAYNDLVYAGLTAPHDVLEGPSGYFPIVESEVFGCYTGNIGRKWLIEDVSVKSYSSG